MAVKISDWAAEVGSLGDPSFKAFDEVHLAPMGVFEPDIFDNSDKIIGRRTLISILSCVLACHTKVEVKDLWRNAGFIHGADVLLKLKAFDEVHLAPMGVFEPDIFDNSDKIIGRRTLIEVWPEHRAPPSETRHSSCHERGGQGPWQSRSLIGLQK
jgi:hypothetical protein